MYGLLSHNDEGYKRLEDLTWHQNKKIYAEKYGYVAFNKTSNWQSQKTVGPFTGFEKIYLCKFIIENVEELEWVWFTGTDSIITNFNIRIEDRIDNDYHIIVAVDVNGINADSLLVRNSPQAVAFLNDVLELESYGNQFWDSEQRAIDKLLGFPGTGDPNWPTGDQLIVNEKYRNVVKLVPQRYMNSFDYSLYHYVDHRDKFGQDGNWQPGDWLLHWPAINLENRIKLYHNRQSQIIK